MTASPVINNVSRREFLQGLIGASAAAGVALGLSGCAHVEDPFTIVKPSVPGAEKWTRGEEKWVASTCAQCPVGCGLRVRVVEGRVVKIEGNNASPINRGGLGPKGQSGPSVLYDPDRLQHPLKRSGPRGSGEWKEISWDDAVTELTAALGKMRTEGNSHQLALLCGRPRGFMVDLWKRFCQVYGTPNFFDPLSTSDGLMKDAMKLMMGVDDLPAYDWENTTFILSLGTSLFESNCQGIYFTRLASTLRQGHAVKRAKIVHVEPAYSLTSLQADEWIKITPGTYDVLALGLANIIVKEELYDKEFIQSHTFGFKSWKDEKGESHKGFLDILEEYPPEKVAEVTGIPQETILQLAHNLAELRPSVVVADAYSTSTSNALEVARCVLALNALLGNIDKPGGILVQRKPPLKPWSTPTPDDIAKAGINKPRLDGAGSKAFPFTSSVVEAFPEQVLEGKPYPIQALFLYYSNPLYSRIRPERFARAFEKIPFIVSFSPYMDESSHMADLILPDHTYLERWEDGTPTSAVGYPVFGIRRPVVKPLYNTRHTGDLIIQLAKSLGGSIESHFPWEDFKEAMNERISGLKKAGRGSIEAEDEKEFLKQLNKKGYWEDPPYHFEEWQGIFKTPSKKFEFWSHTAYNTITQLAKKSNLSISELLKSWDEPADLDLTALPHATTPQWEGDPKEYPLYFMPYKPITYAEGSGANLPWLNELRLLVSGDRWDSWVDLNPDTAAGLGIRNGDMVSITSPAGKISTYARFVDGVPPDVARMAKGQGHTQMGRYAKGKGVNPNEILVPKIVPHSGIAPLCGTRVKVTKI